MTGNVKFPVVSKEEFRRMLMFANSKRSDAVMKIFSKVFFHASWQDVWGLYYKKRR